MSLTPEQEAAALRLASKHPVDPARSFDSASDLSKLARAVLHFAEERDTALLDCEDCLKALANRDAQWAAICAERDALKADVVRLRAMLMVLAENGQKPQPEPINLQTVREELDRKLVHYRLTGKRREMLIGLFDRALAATAPPETP